MPRPKPASGPSPTAARRGVPGQAGVSTIEVVLLAPVLVVFILFVVCLGLIVDAKGQADGAARDAARAGSLERNYANAKDAAQRAAEADLGNQCVGAPNLGYQGTQWHAGGQFVVVVSCTVSLRGLDLLGLGPAKTVTAKSIAPLDFFRRTDDGP